MTTNEQFADTVHAKIHEIGLKLDTENLKTGERKYWLDLCKLSAGEKLSIPLVFSTGHQTIALTVEKNTQWSQVTISTPGITASVEYFETYNISLSRVLLFVKWLSKTLKEV